MLGIAAVVAAVYVVAYPAFAWTYYDLRRFPRRLWSGFGRPHAWRQATVVTYALGGIPVFVTAIVWRTSYARSEMRKLAHEHDGR